MVIYPTTLWNLRWTQRHLDNPLILLCNTETKCSHLYSNDFSLSLKQDHHPHQSSIKLPSLSITETHLINFSDPPVDAIKRPPVGNVIHQQDPLKRVRETQTQTKSTESLTVTSQTELFRGIVVSQSQHRNIQCLTSITKEWTSTRV